MAKERGQAGTIADGAAIGASTLCLVHCLLLPLVIAAFPAVGTLIDLPEAVHVFLFVAAVPISSLAIVSGFRRHGGMLPGTIAAAGLLLIGIGALAGFPLLVETSVSVAGSLVLALGHIWNLRTAGRNLGQGCSS